MPDGSNNPASDMRRAVQEMIALNKATLEKTKSDVRALENKESELLQALNNTTQIMSKLSPELLSEVFLLFCADEWSSYRLPKQFILGRVCRAWRHIAWTTPRLWARLAIDFSEKHYDTQQTLFEEWLERSGDCLLDLSLRVRDQEKWDYPSMESTFQPLLRTCHRWEKLRIVSFPSMALFLEQHQPQFSSLKALVIEMGGYSRDRILAKWNFKSATPHLRSLNTINFLPSPKLGVNWEVLVELQTSLNFDHRPSFELLSMLPSLEHLFCSLEGYRPNFNTSDYPPPDFRNLTLLSMNGHPKMVFILLQSFKTPRLRKLQLSLAPFATDVLWPSAVVDLTRRSSCHISELTISQSDITDEGQILDMLGNLSPSLKKLYLYCPPSYTMSNRTIKRLNLDLKRNRARQQECLPNLETFVFRGNISFTLRAVVDMLRSRQRYLGDLSDLGDIENEDSDIDSGEEDSSSDDENGPEDSPAYSEDGVKQQAHTDTSRTKLFIDIRYPNRTWYQVKNPNRMWRFISKARDYEKKGISFCLEWEKPESDMIEDLDEE